MFHVTLTQKLAEHKTEVGFALTRKISQTLGLKRIKYRNVAKRKIRIRYGVTSGDLILPFNY